MKATTIRAIRGYGWLPDLPDQRDYRYPFVFGFSVYACFETPAVARTGLVPMPARGERVLGGYAVLAAGYDEAAQRFIVRNSWSAA